jgi:hypothetical protein
VIAVQLMQACSREEIRETLIQFDRQANKRQAVPYLERNELT